LDRSLTGYVLRRVLQIPPLLLGISILTFLIFYLSPVNPVVAYLGLATVQKMPVEDVAKVEKQLGLDHLHRFDTWPGWKESFTGTGVSHTSRSVQSWM
jgi:ABC-type dipeptide/oligopeptide/nickel transport system permease component